jgi:hypothetical protein
MARWSAPSSTLLLPGLRSWGKSLFSRGIWKRGWPLFFLSRARFWRGVTSAPVRTKCWSCYIGNKVMRNIPCLLFWCWPRFLLVLSHRIPKPRRWDWGGWDSGLWLLGFGIFSSLLFLFDC